MTISCSIFLSLPSLLAHVNSLHDCSGELFVYFLLYFSFYWWFFGSKEEPDFLFLVFCLEH